MRWLPVLWASERSIGARGRRGRSQMDEIARHPAGEAWEWPEETWRAHRRSRPRRPQPGADNPGRTAPAAPSRSSSTPTTKPSRCATATKARCASARASTATARASRASARLLEREQIRRRFFYPAVSALLHPDEVRGVAGEGHEIGIHSWIHERNTTLPLHGRARPDHARRRRAGAAEQASARWASAPRAGIFRPTR